MAKSLLLDPQAVRDRLAARFRRAQRTWFAGDGQWPIALPLGLPTEQQAQKNLAAVRQWVEGWQRWQGAGELVWCERVWRQLGSQTLPERLLIQSPQQVADWLGQSARWERACARRHQLLGRWPQLIGALARYYELLADYADADFERLCSTLQWLLDNPASHLYIRQLPIQGVDSKWLEMRKSVLLDLLQALRDETQARDFYAVTGLRKEPLPVRFRLLDQGLRQRMAGLGDISAPAEEVAALQLPISRVMIVENLQTGLAFADLPGTLLFMGRGYAVDLFAAFTWVQRLPVWYWGDIDTHGFAILDRLRKYLPAVRSILMDETTLKTHLALCSVEPKQARIPSNNRLADPERRLYARLLDNHWGLSLRLEQERIDWGYAWRRIAKIVEAADERQDR
jgi:hypothetical protein